MGEHPVLAIGGVVGALCRFLVAAGLSGRSAAIGAVLVSLGVVGVYAWAAGDFARETSFDYLAMLAEVILIAAGAFKILESPGPSAVMHRMTGNGQGLVLAIALGGLTLSGCAAGRALVSPQPDPTGVQSVRVLAMRAVEAASVSTAIADQTGNLLNTLPLSTAAKNTYDCALLRVYGTSLPAPASVVQACGGPIPIATEAPFGNALQALGAVTTCPGLRASAEQLLTIIEPLIARLEQSGNNVLQFAAANLRAAFAIVRSLSTGGTPCAN